MKFVIWLLTNAAALAVAAWALDGIDFEGADWQEKLLPLLIVALILGVVNASVGIVLKVLSIPFIIITLGLFLLVINASMLLLTGWIADKLDLGFSVDGFWTAVLGSIIITLVTWMIELTVMER
ncbi:phage holin family protein [Nocardioides guangzhouensis]|uniref:Phage holin family protein n=1 Tax=Nocardioides guangzhouensis TaxID=2497878 RepID=A0A4Q4ZCJ9_9ACTN|nr:phage holin family protein [Nocardioides guangzhouensis]RYP85315.1 phage holin family protein [Nocardioides guangzhouensis]